MIIDSHAHLTHHLFDENFCYLTANKNDNSIGQGTRLDVIAACKAHNVVGSIEPAISFESNEVIRHFQPPEGYSIYRAVGVHPTRVRLTKLRNRRELNNFVTYDTVAIGETGLDYHYPRNEQHQFLQKIWFQYQIRLADKHHLPLILHIREADEDAIKILRHHKSKLHGGVTHCFSGRPEVAQQYLSLGFALGIGGTLLQNHERAKQLRASVEITPLEMLIVETDAPYILPDFPYDGSKKSRRKIRNTSAILPWVISEIARIKEIAPERAEEQIYNNTTRIFHLERWE